MTISFELSMPNRGSWNGGWSGEGSLYAIVKNFGRTQKAAARCAKLLEHPNYYYRWSDGWGANIKVREVTPKEARAVRKNSRGFCGYDWMVASILQHGAIYADHELPKAETQPAQCTSER